MQTTSVLLFGLLCSGGCGVGIRVCGVKVQGSQSRRSLVFLSIPLPMERLSIFQKILAKVGGTSVTWYACIRNQTIKYL